ncbi:MAG: hypothetical protein ACR2IF_15660 [Terriglobales bacterium]
MSKRLILLALCATLVTGTAFARDHDRDRDRHDRDRHALRDRDHDRDHDRDRDRARDARREHRNGVFAQNNGTPPGWSKGKKTGWGDCDVPPGQAKKIGCTPHSTYRRHRHSAYRRPVIAPNSTRQPAKTPNQPAPNQRKGTIWQNWPEQNRPK